MNAFTQLFGNPLYSQEARGTVWGYGVKVSYSVRENGYAKLSMDNFYVRDSNRRVNLLFRRVAQVVSFPLDKEVTFGLDALGTCFQETNSGVDTTFTPMILNGDRRKVFSLPSESWQMQWQDELSVNEIDVTQRYARRTGLLSRSSVVGKIVTARMPFEFGRVTYPLEAHYVYYENGDQPFGTEQHNRLAFLGFVLGEERVYDHVRTVMA